MKKPEHFTVKFNTQKYSILTVIPPFLDIILSITEIDPEEYGRIVQIASTYPNDPRLIEMIRSAGDASAKVPYLLADGESDRSILTALRKIAQPHIDHLNGLPDRMQSTIHTLLSVNKVPVGYETLAIPALIEIDRIQVEMITELKNAMKGRTMAAEFYQANLDALHELDRTWADLRQSTVPFWPRHAVIPDHPKMMFEGYFENQRLMHIYETCVIVDPPKVSSFKKYIPRVLQRPLPEDVAVPETGSADWLIREVGKIGRHCTRALLEIIREHLRSERIALDARNYDRINEAARDILEEFIFRFP